MDPPFFEIHYSDSPNYSGEKRIVRVKDLPTLISVYFRSDGEAELVAFVDYCKGPIVLYKKPLVIIPDHEEP